MGVRVVVLIVMLCMITTMSMPLGYSIDDHEYRHLSYQEKQDKELERLDEYYTELDPKQGGYHGVEMVDFQKIHQNDLMIMQTELEDHDKTIQSSLSTIKTQNEVIQKQTKSLERAQELANKEWGSPKPDNTELQSSYQLLGDMTKHLEELLAEKIIIEKNISIKELLIEILKHDAKLIGVNLSKTCIAMAKTGISSCPTYEDLHTLDNSLTEYSGDFSSKDGWFHREPSNYKESYRAYESDHTIRIIVDPPFNEASRMKMITIVSNFGEFADAAYARTIVNDERTLGKERIITDQCHNAKISADNWKMLLPDTIHTFRNGCESAEISDVIKYDMPKTEITNESLWSSPNIQYSQWLLEMKDKCKVKC